MNPNFPYNAQVNQPMYPPRDQPVPSLPQAQHPSAIDQSQNRRSRVSRACDICRRKKIRCDVDVNFPCSTCVQSSWECTFKEQARKRGPPKGYIGNLENRLKKMEKLLETLSGTSQPPNFDDEDDDDEEEIKEEEEEQQIIERKRPKKSHPSTHPSVSPPTEEITINIPTSKMATNATVNEDNNRKSRLKVMEPKIARYIGSSSGLYLMSKTRDEETMRKSLLFKDEIGTYRFGAASDASDDMMVLRDQIASEQAGDEDREEARVSLDVLSYLVDSYFSGAHQLLPIIDKKTFMEEFKKHKDGEPLFSTALLYSVCSVGCRLLYISDPIFQKCKMSKDQLLLMVMDKATAAVSRNYLNTKMEIIQALVLLASQPNFAANAYTAWMFSGMGVRMAQDLGLHRNIPTWKMNERESEQRKRIWFSVYIVDRWCCAAVGRPLAISEADCDIELPELIQEDAFDNTTTRHQKLFRYMISLSTILGYILRQLYSPKVKAMGLTSPGVASVVFELEERLKNWLDDLPPECKLSESDLNRLKQIRQFPLQRSELELKDKLETAGILTLCQQTLVILLNRPFITTSKDIAINSRLLKAGDNCRNAAKIIADVASALRMSGINSSFEWVFTSYAVYQATLIHLFDCAADSEEAALQAREYVRICVDECLKPVFDSIPHGWRMIHFIRNVLAGIPTFEERQKMKASDSTVPSTLSKGKPLDGPVKQTEAPVNATTNSSNLHPGTLNQMVTSFSDGVTTPDPSTYATGSYPSSLGYPGGHVAELNTAAPFWGASSAFGFDWQGKVSEGIKISFVK
ncbi:hypothetical protein K450DRAFT_66048 [Umbelopsis ramanniana AG]|uniref:Zn(2)-C6 fungal-type domain-containing protein n=1 Tax=Umbelopsis ramanniana AG TaxID=1314678 RepID=A0AAD5EII0_UMBRA|nr:uncharacterized protein K450DRAFT_66048 [Umbelopsis ramanniana AG]KAI8584047.1 hypothetical protein K450DRAFT_66048 [Umbelopsis ramanniana AG]